MWGSKFLSWDAVCVFSSYSAGSNLSIQSTCDFPWERLVHISAGFCDPGSATPIPVMTTDSVI